MTRLNDLIILSGAGMGKQSDTSSVFISHSFAQPICVFLGFPKSSQLTSLP